MFQDGLIRLASEKYEVSKSNTSDVYVHLTNYSLNKKNQKNYDGEKHKLRLSEYLSATNAG